MLGNSSVNTPFPRQWENNIKQSNSSHVKSLPIAIWSSYSERRRRWMDTGIHQQAHTWTGKTVSCRINNYSSIWAASRHKGDLRSLTLLQQNLPPTALLPPYFQNYYYFCGGADKSLVYKENNKLQNCKNVFTLHNPPWAPHTYDFVVLGSLTHPRKILLVVLQIGKAKDLSAPLRNSFYTQESQPGDQLPLWLLDVVSPY
jgi:hypothetical protein